MQESPFPPEWDTMFDRSRASALADALIRVLIESYGGPNRQPDQAQVLGMLAAQAHIAGCTLATQDQRLLAWFLAAIEANIAQVRGDYAAMLARTGKA